MSEDARPPAQDEDDLAPGMAGAEESTPLRSVASYGIGLALSAALTVGAFWLLHTRLVWPPAVPIAIVALAVAQIGVHLVFFLHITTAPDNTNNVLALAFGILIVALVVGGSLWIMGHLDANMLPMDSVAVQRPPGR